jgi:hypothetical protein
MFLRHIGAGPEGFLERERVMADHFGGLPLRELRQPKRAHQLRQR